MAGIGRWRVATSALRYRAAQAAALFLLSLLGVAACAFGPLYERSVENASLRLNLNNTPISARGTTVTAVSARGTLNDALLGPMKSLGRYYGAPVTSDQVGISYTLQSRAISGLLATRDGQCAHLHLVSGRCPSAAGEVAASSTAARAFQLRVGQRFAIGVHLDTQQVLPGGTVTIVGVYAPFDPHDDYWYDRPYSSAAGAQVVNGREGGTYTADTLFAPAGFADLLAAQPAWAGQILPDITAADYPLLVDHVGLDDMHALRSGLAALTATAAVVDPDVRVTSSLPSALDNVAAAQHEARSVIPAFAVELALLVLVVIGIVVVAAADQRRGEFALSRLRGYSAGRSARLLDREFGIAVLVSVVPGLALAWLGCRVACAWWLSDGARPELRWPVLAAAGGVVLTELAVIALVGRYTARRPVHELLRRVPARSSGWRVGIAEVAVAAAALAGTLVVLTGDRHNALAILTPGLIALFAGMLLSRLVAGVARASGKWALWRGHLGVGLAALQVARRPGVRRVVILVCVATALIVSAADQWRVSARNRAVRAGVEAGASVVLGVRAGSAATLQQAVAAADPGGRYAAPVVIQRPVNGVPVVAVEPERFMRVAAWGWPRDRLSTQTAALLTPARPRPITFTGTTLRLHLTHLSLLRHGPPFGGSRPGPLSLLFNVSQADGTPVSVKLGPVPEGVTASALLSATVPCGGGCRLAQISLLRETTDADAIQLSATIAGLDAGMSGALRHVPLGTAAEWAQATPPTNGFAGLQSMTLDSDGSALTLSIANSGSATAVQHLDVPVALPALVTGGVGDNRDVRGNVSDNNIDGLATSFRPVGSVPLVPGADGPAILVDLDRAASVTTAGLGDSTAAVWLSADDPARERALTAILARHGIGLVSRDTAAAHRAVLDATAPAWAMQFALLGALAAVLIAALVIALAANTSRRIRAYDLAALDLVGIARRRLRRAVLLEHTAVAVVGVLAGCVLGVLGARLALPSVPIFLVDVSEPAIVRGTAWGTVMVAGLLTLVVLVVVSLAVGWQLLRRVEPERLRDGES